MKIEAVAVQFPGKVVAIDETVDMIRCHSRKSFQGDLESALNHIYSLLQKSGAQTRRWLTESERPIDIMHSCINEALSGANCPAEDVDMLIYTGLGRGFIEPSQAYMVANSMGMVRAECFDIIDACMSWTRALHLAYHYLHSGTYQRILIVNGEFLNVKGGPLYPDNYVLEDIRQISWLFPTYTLGSAATATLLSLGDDVRYNWQWRFRSRTDWADLCTIPGAEFERFTPAFHQSHVGKSGVGRLSAFGQELHCHALPELVKVLHALDLDLNTVKTIIPHASSSAAWDRFAKAAGVSGKLYHIYPEYGNLISASIPAAMALAYREKRIQRNELLVNWVGSAGMSFSAYALVF